MSAVAVAAGLCVLGAYLMGSIPFLYLQRRSRLRRDLRRHDTGRAGAADSRSGNWLPTVVEVAVVLVAASVAWRVVASVSPGHGSPRIVAGVATFSDQVLVPWQSVALWAGLAATLGQVAPVWLAFRGGSGVAPAAALLAVFSPVGFFGACAGYGIGLAVTRSDVGGTGVAALFLVTTAWVAWVLDVKALWGVPNGPEACLWSAALGAAVFAASRSGRGTAGPTLADGR